MTFQTLPISLCWRENSTFQFWHQQQQQRNHSARTIFIFPWNRTLRTGTKKLSHVSEHNVFSPKWSLRGKEGTCFICRFFQHLLKESTSRYFDQKKKLRNPNLKPPLSHLVQILTELQKQEEAKIFKRFSYSGDDLKFLFSVFGIQIPLKGARIVDTFR